MKTAKIKRRVSQTTEKSVSEVLILADGKILAHNISPLMAGVLAKLNPQDAAMSRRATPKIHLRQIVKLMVAGYFFISTGLQPGGIAGVDCASRFSGFRSGAKAVETAVASAPNHHRAEA